LTTLAYKLGNGPAVYALEGSVAITGALVQWLRDNLNIIQKSSEIEALAKTVDDNGGVYFVPAFSGLFAPYWKATARGVIAGLTRYVNKGHIARAVLEATAFQTREVVDAMKKDSGIELDVLRTDGGMVENNLLMQFQADILNKPVVRPLIKETTALGAAYAAGLAVGFYKNLDDLCANWAVDKTWKPNMDLKKRESMYKNSWAAQINNEETNLMHGPLFGEFMGTMVLILLGDGVVANVLLKKSKGEGSGWIVITTGWGLAVTAGIFTAIACGSPGAHINPAVTLAGSFVSHNWSMVLPFWACQFAGAFVGATLVWLAYLPHWEVTEDQGAKLGIFCTAPAIRNLPDNLMTEIIATTTLVGVGFAFGASAVSPTGLPPGFAPYLWGMLVWVLGLCLGGPTGYAMNPARAFGPRMAHLILPIAGKGKSDFGYALIPIIGPLIGGAIGAASVYLFKY